MRYSNCRGIPRATCGPWRQTWRAHADRRNRRGAAGSCSGERSRIGSNAISTRRMRVRPVSRSISGCKWNRHKMAALHRNHGRISAGQQVLGRAVAQVARVLHVVRNGIRASELVADVFRHERRFHAEFFQTAATCALRISPIFTSAMRRCPCASRSTSCSEERSLGSTSSTTPSAIIATPSRRP